MKVTPTGDNVVIKRISSDSLQKTEGGLLIPGVKVKTDLGEVVAVGPGRYLESGFLKPVSLKVGQRVVIRDYPGMDVHVAGVAHIVVPESVAIAVLED
jgi:chaperonin GroES